MIYLRYFRYLSRFTETHLFWIEKFIYPKKELYFDRKTVFIIGAIYWDFFIIKLYEFAKKRKKKIVVAFCNFIYQSSFAFNTIYNIIDDFITWTRARISPRVLRERRETAHPSSQSSQTRARSSSLVRSQPSASPAIARTRKLKSSRYTKANALELQKANNRISRGCTFSLILVSPREDEVYVAKSPFFIFRGAKLIPKTSPGQAQTPNIKFSQINNRYWNLALRQ